MDLDKIALAFAAAINNISVPSRCTIAFLNACRKGMGECVQNYYDDIHRTLKKAQTAAAEGKISINKQQKLMDTLKNSNCFSKLSHEARKLRNYDTDSLEGINRAMDACNKFIHGIEDILK